MAIKIITWSIWHRKKYPNPRRWFAITCCPEKWCALQRRFLDDRTLLKTASFASKSTADLLIKYHGCGLVKRVARFFPLTDGAAACSLIGKNCNHNAESVSAHYLFWDSGKTHNVDHVSDACSHTDDTCNHNAWQCCYANGTPSTGWPSQKTCTAQNPSSIY